MGYILKNNGIFVVTAFLSLVLVYLSMFLTVPLHADAKKTIKEKSQPSYGVEYRKMNYTNGGAKGRVNMMKMDVSDESSGVQLGKPEPMDNLATVRDQANTSDKKGNKIVGAINANLLKNPTNSQDSTRPVHLISEDNRLVFAGYVNKGKENNFVNEPIAFGMDKNGEGLIDDYNLNLTYMFNGKKTQNSPY